MLKEATFDTTSSFLVRVAWRLLPSILLGFFGRAQSLVLSRKGHCECVRVRKGQCSRGRNKNKIIIKTSS